ncbi:MAG: hypothetical protein ACT4PT_06685 [Methanobacteriota archaeon]
MALVLSGIHLKTGVASVFIEARHPRAVRCLLPWGLILAAGCVQSDPGPPDGQDTLVRDLNRPAPDPWQNFTDQYVLLLISANLDDPKSSAPAPDSRDMEFRPPAQPVFFEPANFSVDRQRKVFATDLSVALDDLRAIVALSGTWRNSSGSHPLSALNASDAFFHPTISGELIYILLRPHGVHLDFYPGSAEKRVTHSGGEVSTGKGVSTDLAPSEYVDAELGPSQDRERPTFLRIEYVGLWEKAHIEKAPTLPSP